MKRIALATPMSAIPVAQTTGLPAIGDDTRVPIRFGLIVIALFFGGLGGWAYFAPLASAVVGSGNLQVSSERRDVQHLEGGVIQDLLVADGDKVNIGDVVLRLDPTRTSSELEILNARQDAAMALKARLQAERDGADHVIFPAALISRNAIPSAAEAQRTETLLFERRRNATEGQVTILEQRVLQLRQQITGIEAQRQSKEAQLVLIARELKGVSTLYKQGLSTTERLLGLERAAEQLRGEIGAHIASIAQAQESIGEARSQILQITRTFQEDVAKELSKVQNDLFDLAGKIRASTDVMERLELRAPVDGYVVGMNVHTKGGVIGPGKTVLQIVPSKDVLVVSVRIQPQESDKVVLGAPAHIRFPSIHDRQLGNLNGTVTYLSADRLADERSGQPYFLVRVAPDTDSLAALKNHVLLPGLPADVMIESGQRTMLQYLISPIIEAFDHSMREQ